MQHTITGDVLIEATVKYEFDGNGNVTDEVVVQTGEVDTDHALEYTYECTCGRTFASGLAARQHQQDANAEESQ